jgi:isoleucyl-tRNA synthetase
LRPFYELYAKEAMEMSKPSVLDKWLLSRLNRLITDATANLDAYDVASVGRAIEQFVVEDLSNWWVRRSRKRSEALPLLRLVLLDVARLTAPFTPFMAEDLFRRMGGTEESVHLADWPKAGKKFINDKLEAEMAAVREVIAAGLAQRKEQQLKVRQPLTAVIVKRAKFGKELEALIKDELNVKAVKYDDKQESPVALDTAMTPALVNEGYARELMRQVQDMRKEAKYAMDEPAMVHWFSFDDALAGAIEQWAPAIKEDTVLSMFDRHRKDGQTYDIEKETEIAPTKKIWLGIKK